MKNKNLAHSWAYTPSKIKGPKIYDKFPKLYTKNPNQQYKEKKSLSNYDSSGMRTYTNTKKKKYF